MNKDSKVEAKKRIEEYFSKEKLDFEQTRKIKNLAMKYRIRLGEKRKRFCKKCYYDLKEGKVKASKIYKTIICRKCNCANRWKIK